MVIKTRSKRFLIFSLLILFFSTTIFASPNDENKVQGDSKANEQSSTSKKSFLQRTDFILQFDPTFYISPESFQNKSNVVNIFYPITFGAIWPTDYFISFQPTLKFFIMEHLWFDKYALPAEIENRTSTTLSFMLDLPAVYTLKLKNNTEFHFSAGLGLFLRFGILSYGVNESDPGYSGTAAQDVELINKWFWDNAHWLYFTFGASWLYPITSKIQVGPVLNAYIPVGTLIDQHNVQGLMFSLGIKLCR